MTVDESERAAFRQMQKLSVAAGGASGASEDARYVIRIPVLTGPGSSMMQAPPPILSLRTTSSTMAAAAAAAAAAVRSSGNTSPLLNARSSATVPATSGSIGGVPSPLLSSSAAPTVVRASSSGSTMAPSSPPLPPSLTISPSFGSSVPPSIALSPLQVPAPPSPIHLPEIKLELSPEELEIDERKRADLVTAFNLYQVNGGMNAKQLQSLMSLLGVSCKTSIAEQLTLLLDRDPDTHIVSRGKSFCIALWFGCHNSCSVCLSIDAFILAVTKYSQMWNRRESRTNFLDRLIRKLNRAIQDIRLARLRHSFDQFDIDHSGKVELAEYINIMRTLGFTEVETKTLQDNFKKMDKAGSGAVGFTQFVEFMVGEKQNKAKLHQLLLSRATAIFNQYVSPSAPNQVNIKGPTREDITKELESGIVSTRTFDRAEKEILKLLVCIPSALPHLIKIYSQLLGYTNHRAPIHLIASSNLRCSKNSWISHNRINGSKAKMYAMLLFFSSFFFKFLLF
jgi:Ca2+-binding EF-hand superfamily protein